MADARRGAQEPADLIGVEAPPELIGIHVNMPGVFPPDIDALLESDITGASNALSKLPSNLSAEERRACEQGDFVWKHVGYALWMATRPQTATGLADSPVGLAAFLLDHDAKSLDLISRAFAGQPGGLTRDDVDEHGRLLGSPLRGEQALLLRRQGRLPSIPVAVSVFPDELYEAPKSWAEQAYPNLIYYNKLDKGGHFAAWEQPQLFCDEMRAAFRSLR